MQSALQAWITENLAQEKAVHARLNEIIRKADIKINGVEIQELKEEGYKFPPDFPEEKKKEIIDRNRFQLFGVHDLYEDRKPVGEVRLDFKEESHGTQTLFPLAGLFLMQMRLGGTLFVDELDTSLHPDLTRMLVALFQSEQMNPKHTQLIFTTHDTTLLDSGLLRKDQVWFTEKDEFGETDFYSLQDFDGVRETTAFDKWYHAGKFGAKPNLDKLLLLL